MRWQGKQGSSNVDDRRRGRTKKVGAGIGIGSILILIFGLLMGENPLHLLQQMQGQQQAQTTTVQQTGGQDDELARFVSVVLKETEDVWNDLFPKQLNRRYQEPTLVLFTQQDRSDCGFASAATGPFYCPADQSVYIDLSFYQQLKTRFNAPGDFAMAYVVAHEVAHHVQYLLGITTEVDRQRGRISQKAYNNLSVRLELQADFLAGVWAHHAQRTKGILEEGDIEEALTAANAIGDDRLQMQSKGYVVPDSFTHGTSEQRMRWFLKGFKTGDLSQGDTFAAQTL
ncbi:MAG: neutral zinc metallopeptidase [Bacteroidota bacterium]